MDGEIALYCINSACPAQLVRNLEHFSSRTAMDIDGMGIKIVEQLAQSGLVKDLADIFDLTEKDLLNLEGFAEKKAQNLILSISASKQRSLPRLMIGLGIQGVGEVMAADLAKEFGELDALKNASRERLQTVNGIGPNIADSIVDWFAHKPNQQLLERLRKRGIWPTYTESASPSESKSLAGKIFVITGALPKYSREEAKMLIESNGGKVTDTISKKTDYLVLGENPGSKLQKAKSLNIPILDAAGLERLISAKERLV
jgi:DNA ligase (NAD+)